MKKMNKIKTLTALAVMTSCFSFTLPLYAANESIDSAIKVYNTDNKDAFDAILKILWPIQAQLKSSVSSLDISSKLIKKEEEALNTLNDSVTDKAIQMQLKSSISSLGISSKLIKKEEEALSALESKTIDIIGKIMTKNSSEVKKNFQHSPGFLG